MIPILLAIGIAAAPPQDGKTELRDALRRYDREAALKAARALLEQGTRAALDTLLSAVDLAADEEESIGRNLTETRRTERRVFHEYRKSSENVDRPRLLQELQQLEKNILALEERIALMRGIRELITEGAAKFTDARATQFLLERMSGSGSWATRHACAYATAFNSTLPFESAVPALLRLLESEKHPVVKIQIIDALRARRDKREVVVQAMHRRLEGDPWPVAAAAVEYLQEISAPLSVPALIDAMARFDGRLRNDIRDALAAMTGESRPADPVSWKSWWETNGEAFLGGTYSPPGGRSATVGFYTDFFGIPVRSSRILFVLDRSDSMGQRARWKVPEPDPSLPADVKPGGDTKLDMARFQVKKVLSRLPKGARFNIVAYGDGVRLFSELPAGLNEETRRQAFAYIDELTASGGTNFFSAIEQLRSFVLPPSGKAPTEGFDTVYLLSDGLPSAGAIRDTSEITRTLGFLARASRIRIHTVYTGGEGDLGKQFMRQAAAGSGGTFVEPER